MKKFQLNKQYLTIGLYCLGVAVVSLLFGLIVFNLGGIFGFLGRAIGAIKALPYGILLALILYPFVILSTKMYSRLLEKRRPRPRLVSALSLVTVYLGMLLVLGILILGIVPPMIDTVSELIDQISSSYTVIEASLRELMAKSDLLASFADATIEFVRTTLSRLVSTDIASVATSLLAGFVGEAFDILVGLVISIYLLAGRHMMGCLAGKCVAAILPAGGSHRVTMFIKRLYANFTEFISARILSALFLGGGSYLFFRLLGIPYYPILTLVIMVLNFFPVFGTIFSFLVCGVVLLITKPFYTLPVLLILAALELIDNLLIEPHTLTHKVLRQNVGATIVLLLCGYALLGIFGALIAIPVYATIQNSLRAFSVHLLNRRGLPSAIEEYENFNIRLYMTPEQNEGEPLENAATKKVREARQAREARRARAKEKAETAARTKAALMEEKELRAKKEPKAEKQPKASKPPKPQKAQKPPRATKSAKAKDSSQNEKSAVPTSAEEAAPPADTGEG